MFRPRSIGRNPQEKLAVRAVRSEPVSGHFPDKQGKNREFSKFWAEATVSFGLTY
jgi:hypothetical protein